MSKTREGAPSPPPVDVPSIIEVPAGLAPSTTDLGILSHYSALPALEGAGVMTTLDLRQPANIVRLQHALAGSSDSLWDLSPDRVLGITDLAAHYASAVDEETGEIRSGPMIALIGPDGVYHTGSQFVFRALQLIAMLKGRPPWQPPIRMRAVRVRSRNKREFQSIVLAE